MDGAVVSAGGGAGAQPPPLTDSGVGESVGGGSSSTANMLGKNSTFYNRNLHVQFSSFTIGPQSLAKPSESFTNTLR